MKVELKRAARFAGVSYRPGFHTDMPDAVADDDNFKLLKSTGKLFIVDDRVGTLEASDIAALVPLVPKLSSADLEAAASALSGVVIRNYKDQAAATAELFRAAFTLGSMAMRDGLMAYGEPQPETANTANPLDGLTKAEIIAKAKDDFGLDLDPQLKKEALEAAYHEAAAKQGA